MGRTLVWCEVLRSGRLKLVRTQAKVRKSHDKHVFCFVLAWSIRIDQCFRDALKKRLGAGALLYTRACDSESLLRRLASFHYWCQKPIVCTTQLTNANHSVERVVVKIPSLRPSPVLKVRAVARRLVCP